METKTGYLFPKLQNLQLQGVHPRGEFLQACHFSLNDPDAIGECLLSHPALLWRGAAANRVPGDDGSIVGRGCATSVLRKLVSFVRFVPLVTNSSDARAELGADA